MILSQNKLKRCCILIAIRDEAHIWRLRFRVLVTKQNGVLIFPLQKTFHANEDQFIIPDEFKLNTIAVIGLEPQQACFYALVNVFTTVQYSDFIGVDISGYRDVTDIGDVLLSRNAVDRRFDATLYENEPQPLGSFMDRRARNYRAAR